MQQIVNRESEEPRLRSGTIPQILRLQQARSGLRKNILVKPTATLAEVTDLANEAYGSEGNLTQHGKLMFPFHFQTINDEFIMSDIFYWHPVRLHSDTALPVPATSEPVAISGEHAPMTGGARKRKSSRSKKSSRGKRSRTPKRKASRRKH